jgi:molybdopterin converting factor small subunit
VKAEDGAGPLLRIHVRFYNIIADRVGKRDEVRWVADGSTIDDLLQLIAAEYPALSRYASAGDRLSSKPFRLFRNGRIVLDAGEPLASKDEIRIFPIISGG